MAIVTKEYIENYCTTKTPEQVAQFVGRALVVIFNNQTADEKAASTTNVDNGIGFTGADAHSGCITAKTFLKRGALLDWQVERWTKRNKKGTMRIAKYHKQLNEADERKAVKATPRSWEQVNKAISDVNWSKLDMSTVERNMKNAFAEHERKQEERAFMNKEIVRSNATTYRRAIRSNADRRSL